MFSDEAGFCLHPKLGRGWTKRGQQPVVWTRSQHPKRVNVFGWVNPVSGNHGMIRQPRGNTDGFLVMLRTILCRCGKNFIDLWVDQARWHKGAQIDGFLSKQFRLKIHYIPQYHPELNPQEILWRTMRYEETTNMYYESIQELVNCIFSRSQSWKPKKVLSLYHLI